MTDDDYLGEIDDDPHTINGPAARTASIGVRSSIHRQRSFNLEPALLSGDSLNMV